MAAQDAPFASFRHALRRFRLPSFLASAASILLIACGGGSPPESPPPGSQPAGASGIREPARTQIVTEAPPITIAYLGEVARTDTAEITVHAVRLSLTQGGETAPEGLAWVLLDITVRNLGTEPEPFHVALVRTDASEFERAHLPGLTTAFEAPIDAGATVRGEVAYLVRAGTINGTLIYGLDSGPTWAIQLRLPDQ